MTRRERVIGALRHEQTDFVPYAVDFTEQAWTKLQAQTHDPEILEKYGTHLHYFQYWGYPMEIEGKSLYFKDDFGVTWNRSGADRDIGVVDHPVIDEADISFYPEPVLHEARIRAECEACIRSKKDKFCFAGIGFSLFERLWSYCGMENALIFMLTDREFVATVLDKICEFNLRIIDIMNEYDFDGFYFGDDWGQQKGLIMGAPLWREFIKPRLKRMYDRAKKNGKFILQHSCGDIQEIFPDLIEIGLDCYQTFQPEIYDIAAVKAEFGKHLCFWGGLSTQRALPYMTPEQIRLEVRRLIEIMRKGGGYIVAPTHALAFDVPVDNILAMLDEFKSQNKI